ncbi:MAG: PhzF family phenazine biosynthesis protein, partial [Candidatus Adiutrix sp.]
MITKIFLVDTFTDGPFSGGRSHVVLLRQFGQEAMLQGLASELGGPMTAYVMIHDEKFIARYFTPMAEVYALGNYASLAVGHTLFESGLAPGAAPVRLYGRGGETLVERALSHGDEYLSVSLAPTKFNWDFNPKPMLESLSLGANNVLAAAQSLSGAKFLCLKNKETLMNIKNEDAIAAAQGGTLFVSAPNPVAPAKAAYLLRSFSNLPANFEVGFNLQ